MPSFDPALLASWTGGSWVSAPATAPVGFSVDSRALSRGQAFVALRTARRDGHDFLGDALGAGAAAAIVSREVAGVALAQLVVRDPLAALQAIAREHRRGFGGTVFGVTGSAGKTTTKEMLALLLGGEAGGVMATEGNLNNHIGVALTLCRLDPTRHRFAVVEAGISAPGEMQVLSGMIQPDVVVTTMVGPAHLAELGGLEGVAREKAALARSVKRGGLCLFPSSCLSYAAFRELPASSSLVLEPVAQLGAGQQSLGEVRFAVAHSAESTTVSLGYGALPGVILSLRPASNGVAQNAALAACAALKAGVRRDELQARMLRWAPAPMRGEWRLTDERSVYLDCYNANPASMADALAAFEAATSRLAPRLFVVGCMEELGADSERYHTGLGRSLRLAAGDRLFAVGALSGAIRQGALSAGARPDQVETSESVGPLSERIAAFRGAIFVKGSRRHELEKAFPETELAGVSHA
jgi:UDP-N-acetylmuramoyl-tripeptide--D-alanyl-D-alanine ligase